MPSLPRSKCFPFAPVVCAKLFRAGDIIAVCCRFTYITNVYIIHRRLLHPIVDAFIRQADRERERERELVRAAHNADNYTMCAGVWAKIAGSFKSCSSHNAAILFVNAAWINRFQLERVRDISYEIFFSCRINFNVPSAVVSLRVSRVFIICSCAECVAITRSTPGVKMHEYVASPNMLYSKALALEAMWKTDSQRHSFHDSEWMLGLPLLACRILYKFCVITKIIRMTHLTMNLDAELTLGCLLLFIIKYHYPHIVVRIAYTLNAAIWARSQARTDHSDDDRQP